MPVSTNPPISPMRPIPMIQKSMMACLLFLLVSLPACILVVDEDDLYDDDLRGSRWRLNVVVYLGRSYTVPHGEIYTVNFDSRHTLLGRADCNDYDASYDLTLLGGIRINDIYVTDGYCGGHTLEDLFLDGLEYARSYNVQRDALTIRSRGDDYVLYFYRD